MKEVVRSNKYSSFLPYASSALIQSKKSHRVMGVDLINHYRTLIFIVPDLNDIWFINSKVDQPPNCDVVNFSVSHEGFVEFETKNINGAVFDMKGVLSKEVVDARL